MNLREFLTHHDASLRDGIAARQRTELLEAAGCMLSAVRGAEVVFQAWDTYFNGILTSTASVRDENGEITDEEYFLSVTTEGEGVISLGHTKHRGGEYRECEFSLLVTNLAEVAKQS